MTVEDTQRTHAWSQDNHAQVLPRTSQDSESSNTKRAKVLAFVSGKGGPGKTVLSVSFAHVLTRVGKKVLLIDTDFITRGASYFVIGDAAESESLDIDPASALYRLLTDPVLQENAQPAVIRRPEGDEYHVFFSDTDLFKGGQIDTDAVKGVEPSSCYRGLKNLCERFRSQYDYIILDTHGGYDSASAIPALVADGFVVVLEIDKLSINQTRLFLNSIDSYHPTEDGSSSQKRLEGFISNKWIYKPEDLTILTHLKVLFGGIPAGNVPWDINVVLDYGNKYMPLVRHPGTPFAFYAIQAFSKLLGPHLNWRGSLAEQKFNELEVYHRRKWKLKRLKGSIRRFMLIGSITSLISAALTYLLYQKTGLLLTLKIPLVCVVAFLVLVGFLCADQVDQLLTRKLGDAKEKPRSLRLSLSIITAAVFMFTVYVVGFGLPANLNNTALLARIMSQQLLIDHQNTQVSDLNTQLLEAQSNAQLVNLDLQTAEKRRFDLQQQNAALQSQLGKQSSALTDCQVSLGRANNCPTQAGNTNAPQPSPSVGSRDHQSDGTAPQQSENPGTRGQDNSSGLFVLQPEVLNQISIRRNQALQLLLGIAVSSEDAPYEVRIADSNGIVRFSLRGRLAGGELGAKTTIIVEVPAGRLKSGMYTATVSGQLLKPYKYPFALRLLD